MALVRAADSEQDAAIYLTAAFTGLRQGELVALRWRDRQVRRSASVPAIRTATSPRRSPARSARCRWRRRSPRRSRASASAPCSPTRTTWSSRASSAATSKAPRCPSAIEPCAREPWPHLQAGLGQRASRARRGVLVDRPPARPDRRLLRARQGQARPLDRDRRRGAEVRLPVLVSAHARRGLRVRAALADHQEAAPPRAHRRRPAPPRRPRRLVDQQGDAPGRTRPRAAGPARLRTHRRRLAGQQSGCGRDTGARISKAVKRHSSAADLQAPAICALARQSPAPERHSPTGARSDPHDLTFIRHAKRHSAKLPLECSRQAKAVASRQPARPVPRRAFAARGASGS